MRTLHWISVSACVALMGLAISSSATIISGTKQKVELYSVPDSCTVWLNGQNTNLTTPCTIKVKRKLKPTIYNSKNQQHYVFKKEGYYDFEHNSTGTFNPVIIGNTGSLVPLGMGWSQSDYSEGRVLTPDIYAAGAIATPIVAAGVDYVSGAVLKYENRIFANLQALPPGIEQSAPSAFSFTSVKCEHFWKATGTLYREQQLCNNWNP